MKTLKLKLKKFFSKSRQRLHVTLAKNPRKTVIWMFALLCLIAAGTTTKAVYGHIYAEKKERSYQLYSIPKEVQFNKGLENDIMNLMELNSIKKELNNIDTTNIDTLKLKELNNQLDKLLKNETKKIN